MSNTILLKLSIPDSDAHAYFSTVEGLENQTEKTQVLTFSEGEVYGLPFIRFLGGLKNSAPAQFKLEMINLNSLMAVWNFSEITLINYNLYGAQETEKCLKIQNLQLYARLE